VQLREANRPSRSRIAPTISPGRARRNKPYRPRPLLGDGHSITSK
jgi:hypothetical protein